MSEIYLVLECDGSYEDYCERPLKAFSTEPAARALVDAMKARKAQWKINNDFLMMKQQEWINANPRPMAPRGHPKPLPSFPGFQKTWTAEQKALLRKTKDKNEQISTELMEKNRAWHVAFGEYRESIIANLPEQEREDLKNFSKDIGWQVEPIPYE